MDPSYTEQYENFERRHWWFAARRRILQDALTDYVPGAAAGNGRWLDVGCGTGVLLGSYAGFAEKVGAELDPRCVQRARNSGLDVRPIQPSWDFSELGTFDCVSLCDVLEHVEREPPALEAARAALKEGGILLVTVPALMSLWSDHDVINHHFRRYRREELLRRFPPEQWEILKVSYFSTLLLPMIWLIRRIKLLTKRLRGSAGVAAPKHDFRFGNPWVDRALQSAFQLEQPLLRRGSLPIGSSLLLVARKRSSTGTPPMTVKNPPFPIVRWAALGLVSILFMLVQLHFSIDRGKLARPPTYDDVTYFVDALDRLDAIYLNGWLSLIPNYLQSPPHSPFSTYVATAAYLIFGIKDWAPYVMNAGLVFALLWSTDYLMRGARLWQRIFAAAFVLSVPISGYLVFEFRPDLPWGLAAAVAVILALRASLIDSGWRYRLLAGAWFAAALLCKPPTFPLTLLTVGLAWFLSAACDRITKGRRISLTRIAGAWMICALPVLIFAIPYYATDFSNVLSYIYQNMFGRYRTFWLIPGGWTVQALYFLIGAGRIMLDHHLFILATVLALGAVHVIAHARADRDRFLRAASLAAITFLAYLVPSANPLKNPNLGAEFQFLLILGAIMSVRMLMPPRRTINAHVAVTEGTDWGTPILVLMTLIGIACWQFPIGWGGPAEIVTANTNRVVHAVEQVLAERAPDHAAVFFTGGGRLNNTTIAYLLRQDGKSLAVSSVQNMDDLNLYAAGLDSSNFVVAAEPGVGEFESFLPSYNILAQTLQLVRNRPEFDEIAVIPSQTGRRFFIFERTPRFGGWRADANLSAQEGPFPQSKLSVVRWGLYPAVSLSLTAEQSQTLRLSAHASAPMDGQEVTIMLDGRTVAHHRFAQAGIFETIEISLDATAGDHEISLAFSKFIPPSPRDQRSLAVLFDRLQLYPMTSPGSQTRP